jgi:hypothetical protein
MSQEPVVYPVALFFDITSDYGRIGNWEWSNVAKNCRYSGRWPVHHVWEWKTVEDGDCELL